MIVHRQVAALSAFWISFACGWARAAATCESLANVHLPDTTITSARSVAAGTFTPPQPENAPGAPSFKSLPAFCQVAGVIKPSSDSEIHFEVWMPANGWNGRFQGIGNGGFAGSINYGGGLANAIANGYAAASTDTGHTQNGDIDAQWALDHPEKVIDFGYRAVHATTENGKAIVRAFYGEAPKYSYFSSCSNGGRQALMEAQRFPADYDGIIAGAPANEWTHLFAGFIWNAQALGEPGGYIPPAKFTAIETAALMACDTLDGVQDGVIDDPSKCHFNPDKLLCLGDESASCLTAPQVRTLKRIYEGPKNSKGEQLFPGFPPGGAAGLLGWTGWITGMSPEKSAQFAFGTQFYANMVFDKAAWDYRTFNFDRDLKVADAKVAKVLNATDPNLKPFVNRKGKLILFHGWSDAAIPAPSTIHYYQEVISKMGSTQADSFVRLFLAPGMQHCAGGPGPNSFGQIAGPVHDADHDIGKAMEHWVEDGVAPERIIATKYKTDLNPASGVTRTRPLCAYPLVARYQGTGSTDDAANFKCAK